MKDSIDKAKIDETYILPIQPTINMGIVGHVDHGKTTITKLLSGKWTDTHSEEQKRGITIKLGYTNFIIYEDTKTKTYTTKKAENTKPIKKISIVDAPGHESFMATMISGAAIMDYALLIIAADEKCPQPQTIEHLKTLEIAGIKNIIVIQNKIDLVSKEEALENYKQIKEFLKTTSIKDAPIIPISAQYKANFDELLKIIVEQFGDVKRDKSKESFMHIVRSFDINKPGDDYTKLKGGVLGGSVRRGSFKIGDEIEIKPGLTQTKDGKTFYKPIYAKIKSLMSDKDKLDTVIAGGSVAVMTELDPSLTKTDFLVGQGVGIKGELPDPLFEINFEPHLFDKVVTSKNTYEVKGLFSKEPLMIIANSLTTVGIVSKTKQKTITVNLKKPILAFKGERIVIFRKFEGNKWRIIGHGIIE